MARPSFVTSRGGTLAQFAQLGPRLWKRCSIVVASLVIGLPLLVLATFTDGRTFIVEAHSYGVGATFLGNHNTWQLRGAYVCQPLAQPDPRATPDPALPCSTAIYDVTDPAEVTLSWPAETRILVSKRQGADLVITIAEGRVGNWPAGTIFIQPARLWQNSGMLAIQGHVQIGSPVGPGNEDYLLGGTWQAFQTGIGTKWLRKVSEAVRQGDLIRGAAVSLRSGTGEASAYAYLTPVPRGKGLGVVVISERGDIDLSMQLFGASGPTIIRTNWIDTLLASPLVLAGVAALTFLSLLTQLLSSLFAASRRRGDGG